MPKITNQTIEEVKNRADIVDLISGYVTLKPSGKNFVGLCPFHDEKTGSFYVLVDHKSGTPIYYCQGCKESGNVIDFLVKKGVFFPEAVKELAKRYNIEIVYEDDGKKKPDEQERVDLRDANEFAQKYFRRVLHEFETYKIAERYLTIERKIPVEWLEKFQIGYTIHGLYNGLYQYAKEHNGQEDKVPLTTDNKPTQSMIEIAKKQGFNLDKLIVAGLVRENKDGKLYDFFRGRIMFPIHDIGGRIIAFSGRYFPQEDWPEPDELALMIMERRKREQQKIEETLSDEDFEKHRKNVEFKRTRRNEEEAKIGRAHV